MKFVIVQFFCFLNGYIYEWRVLISENEFIFKMYVVFFFLPESYCPCSVPSNLALKIDIDKYYLPLEYRELVTQKLKLTSRQAAVTRYVYCTYGEWGHGIIIIIIVACSCYLGT
jgi:hypothetical protein